MLVIGNALGIHKGFLLCRVDHKIPASSRRKFGKAQLLFFPVHVHSDIDQLRLFGSAHIILAQTDTDGMAEMAQVRFPCFRAVQREIRVTAAEIVRILKRHCPAKDRVFLSESNDLFDIIANALSGLTVVPQHPSRLIVLTIRVIISELGVECFIARIHEQCSL